MDEKCGDKCEVYWCSPAARELRKLARKDPKAAIKLQANVGGVEEYGWTRSTRIELIKVLKEESRIGEIRDMGRTAHRAIFYWEESKASHDLYITAIPKKNILKPARLNEFIEAAENRRRLEETEGDNDEDTEEADQ